MIDQEHSGNAMKSPMRALILLLLLAQFALALQYSFHNPLGEAPDEADHWAYVVQLATARTLPVGPTLTQAKHPPLYYMGAALFAAGHAHAGSHGDAGACGPAAATAAANCGRGAAGLHA